jgi:hypothetical protein
MESWELELEEVGGKGQLGVTLAISVEVNSVDPHAGIYLSSFNGARGNATDQVAGDETGPAQFDVVFVDDSGNDRVNVRVAPKGRVLYMLECNESINNYPLVRCSRTFGDGDDLEITLRVTKARRTQ